MAKRKKRRSKSHPVLAFIIVLILIAAIIAAVVGYFIRPDLYHKYLGIGSHTFGEWTVEKLPTCTEEGLQSHVCSVCGKEEEDILAKSEHQYDINGVCTVCGFDKNFLATEAEVASSSFSVHLIDLGKNAGDSIYIRAGENDVLIDAGSRAESAPLICEYLNKYVTDGKLEYVIATHADQDHIAAFAGSVSTNKRTGVLYNFQVDTLIKFDNVESDKNKNETNTSTVYGKFCAAVSYLRSAGANVYTAGQCYREEGGAKRQYWLDDEHTLSMNILYNYYYDHVSGDENNHSVVTLFTKDTSSGARRNFLFTGDLEKEGEEKLVEYYKGKTEGYDVLPQVDFYKAGHHGSGTSSSPELLEVIKPKYVAISCCAGSPEYTLNNSNTFPYKVTFEHILPYTDKIYCTGQAYNLPALSNGKFSEKEWDYKPYNGNITFLLSGGADNIKLHCSGTDKTILESDWYGKYRA